VPAGKLTSLADAVAKWVPDACSVALCTSLESLIPFAAGHEIIRQRKRDLTLIGPISDILFDQIIGGGCVGKVEAAWVGNVITGSAYRFRQAVECGAVEMVDHSNLTLAMGLKAGALGVPYLPVRTALGSDLVSRGRHFAKIACPFSGQPLCAVKAICPDAAIVHVQRCDADGNAHAWGNLGVARDALMASRRVILTCEEVVPPEIIKSDPNRVIVPAFAVDAVVHVPWGAHPSPVPGYYNRDHQAYLEYRDDSRTEAGFAAWRRCWIDAVRTVDDYRRKVGPERLKTLALTRHDFAESVDYGY